MAREKKKFKAPRVNQEELKKFNEHLKLIEEKTKTISERYQKWWDVEKKTWKKGYEQHGNS